MCIILRVRLSLVCVIQVKYVIMRMEFTFVNRAQYVIIMQRAHYYHASARKPLFPIYAPNH